MDWTALSESPVVIAIIIALTLICIAVLILGRKLLITVGKIHVELQPNGGSTLKDAVTRLEQRVTKIDNFVDELKMDRAFRNNNS